MDYRIKDMTNKKFSRLTALEFSHTGVGGAFWLFKCDCGNQKIINGSSVRLGKTTSCGCFAKEEKIKRMQKHGLANTRTYNIWIAIKQRCLNPKNTSYENYGKRGITIPNEWLVFENFYKDMGEAPENKSIERVNNEKGYSKENCIWAGRSEQNINKRYENKTTGIKNICYLERDNLYEVGFSRNKKRYRKCFKKLEDAVEWKNVMLEELGN